MVDLFIPGRLCLLGEHTDWASGKHRLANDNIPLGYCIVCATNEGLFAQVESHDPNRLCYQHVDSSGVVKSFDCSLTMEDAEALKRQATERSFFSYVVGCVVHLMTLPAVTAAISSSKQGIRINNYKTTLPMKKGLSSSAAICVLVVSAFSIHYGIGMTRDEIMDAAFQGELMTGAKCGRMDQAVAMGAGRVGLMTFDGHVCKLEDVFIGGALHFVVVDLKRGKDTVKILSDLNAAFPFPQTPTHELMHEYVRNNVRLSADAIKALEACDAAKLSECMRAAQVSFDRCAIPNCPEELTAPRLHEVISNPALCSVSLAVKGVGSQGDGSAQVLCADEKAQHEALRILQEELGCEGFILTIPASHNITTE